MRFVISRDVACRVSMRRVLHFDNVSFYETRHVTRRDAARHVSTILIGKF